MDTRPKRRRRRRSASPPSQDDHLCENSTSKVFKKVDFQCQTNNDLHHTCEITTDQLIVRRGQQFVMILDLLQPFNPGKDQLLFTASTGEIPEQDRGTLSVFGIPDSATKRSKCAKAVWKVELCSSSTQQTRRLILDVKPPADAPIGKYTLSLIRDEKEGILGELFVLFNPWCEDDWVFMPDERKRQEYVMNEQGIVYTGSSNYIRGVHWDFGQFEDEILEICLRLLDLNHKHEDDPADDVSARCNPIYVSRVISAMINANDDSGVLLGRWTGDYCDGRCPTSWSSSTDILTLWHDQGCHPVKYGQCWVFAAVMCSVMRCLGIPCRVVTNFRSAHDTDMSLTIDVFHDENGVVLDTSEDSIWNFHVWVEGWMRRPDLTEEGTYDGWQVLDPTPQELSDGVHCCGPAPVKAIRSGNTDQKYDVPFVFAEVNADCVDWMVTPDGTKVQFHSNTNHVGYKISTKCIGSNKRHNVTRMYKHKEGSKKERDVFKHARSRDYCKDGFYDSDGDEAEEEMEEYEEEEEEAPDEETKKEICLQFEEMSTPVNGQDVYLKLLLHSKDSVPRPLTIKITVQTTKYTGRRVGTVLHEEKNETLEPDKSLSIPIQIPFSDYSEHMVDCDSMKVSVVVTDNLDNNYLIESDITLEDPPLSIALVGKAYLYRTALAKVLFRNRTSKTLKDCCLTVSGSGLLKDNIIEKLEELKPNHHMRLEIPFTPHKIGKKTLMADFDCSMLRDIKGKCEVDVLPYSSYWLTQSTNKSQHFPQDQ